MTGEGLEWRWRSDHRQSRLRLLPRLLGEVRKGRSFIVTSHGRAVARLSPAVEEKAAERAARDALLGRLRKQTAIEAGRWARDELYERDGGE